MRSGGTAGLRSGLAWPPVSARSSSDSRSWSGWGSGAPGYCRAAAHTHRPSTPSRHFMRCMSWSGSQRSGCSPSTRGPREERRGARSGSGGCSGTSSAPSGLRCTSRSIWSDRGRIDMSRRTLLLVLASAAALAAGCKGYRTEGFKAPMKLGGPSAPTADPWQKEAAAVERGRAVYHGAAQCLSCHPSFAPKRYIYEVTKQLKGKGTTAFRQDMYGSDLTKSEYGVKLLPPDFTRTELRSVRPDHQLEDLYRVIVSGVGGTAMPTWKGALPEEDLWALVHFVDSLVKMKGTDAPRRLRAEWQADDAAWIPPPK